MHLRTLLPTLLLSLPILTVGCGDSSTPAPTATGGAKTGGLIATGGASVTGGVPSTGGLANTGGATATGGLPSAGGMARTGGATVSGGLPATGGATGSGGSAATGGTSTTGGTRAGGAAATGGVTVTGGAATAGGATVTGGATVAGGTTVTGGATATGGTTATGGSTATPANQIWISPTGDDANPGTKESPMKSLCDSVAKVGACYKLCPTGANTCPAAGATIWVMEGTYKQTQSIKIVRDKGALNEAGRMTISAVVGATAKPVFDFTGQAVDDNNRGFQLQGNYWTLKGVAVTKAGDSGIFIQASNVIVENCAVYGNADTGIQIGTNSGAAAGTTGNNNQIINCDSYRNKDATGENADGFGLKEDSGTGNIFKGCRAWENADDGWDFYGWASPITVEDSWAISATSTIGTSDSDGNGFKLGGNGLRALHVLKNCYATDNKYGSSGRGFTNNSNPAALSCSGTCASWGNKQEDTGVSGVGTSAPSGATAAKMIAAKRDANGNLPSITSL